MQRKTVIFLCAFQIFIFSGGISLTAQKSGNAELPTIAEKTKNMDKYEGYFNFYWDAKEGKIWLEIPDKKFEFLYMNSLPQGIGSNDIGLDRGMITDQRVVYFERVGPKVMLIQPNYRFRASSDNLHVKRAVEESFAKSILWGFTVAAESKGAVLVDATDFLMQDVLNIPGGLRRTNQGNYRQDKTRCTFYLPNTVNFPENTEIELMLTFTTDQAGRYVRETTPTPEAVTVHERHSFIKLPDSHYEPRKFDPRMPSNAVVHYDYATPLGEPITQRWIARHRLKKKNPHAEFSEPVEPIIYYVDRGIPEPILSAVIEGAQWWNKVFEAAGYKDAFQVRLLPEGASPLDIRYNMIQWIHRLTRGWSYGNSITDPRTGEIIKGHVSLGSLRVRQDYLLAEGLLAPYDEDGTVPDDMKEMALMRIRQLSCHEVGHTLGFMHNYASSVDNRSSVMDYPAPLVKITDDGKIDLSDAYRPGPGIWDELSVRYAYSDFPPGADEKAELEKIIKEGFEMGIHFIADRDATHPGAAHPLAHQWDNGEDAVEMLRHEMKVRKIALEQFGEKNIKMGEPLALMEEVLVPVYFHHRYQLTAASKVLGGVYYEYTLRGDGQELPKPVPAKEQYDALESLLETITPEALAFPEAIIQKLPPRPPGYSEHRELFSGQTGLTFDPFAPAAAAATMTVKALLQHERAARLIDFNLKDSKYPGLSEVIDRLLARTWYQKDPADMYKMELKQVVEETVVRELMNLAVTPEAAHRVKAVATLKLDEIWAWINNEFGFSYGIKKAHYMEIANKIERFMNRPFEQDKELITPEPPPGSPIGIK